jgi:hypothetical protein
MIELPGLDSTHYSDGEIFLDIAGWMAIAYEKKLYLSGIVYLHPITDRCMRGSSFLSIRMFKELVGSKNSFSQVTIVSTMWDKLDLASIGVAREDELTATEDFWGSIVKRGSRVARHSNSRDSAMSIVDSIVERQRTIVLGIQDEMVNKRLRLDETAAGRFLIREIKKERNKSEVKDLDLLDEIREAVAQEDLDAAQIASELLEESQERNDRRDQEVRNLRVSFENLKWEREQEFEKILDEIS